MANAHRHRFDGYGHPLPELAQAQRKVTLDSEQNKAMRRYLLSLLEREYAHLFHKGVNVTLHVVLKIQDGTVQNDLYVHARQRHHHEPEEDVR